jgi:hypothetical protein
MCRGTTNGEDVYIIDVTGLDEDYIGKLANPYWIRNQGGIPVDACIGNEIEMLVRKGVITVGSCCGHGHYQAHALIREESVALAISLGYETEPYYYADGEYSGLHRMDLKAKVNELSDDEYDAIL